MGKIDIRISIRASRAEFSRGFDIIQLYGFDNSCNGVVEPLVFKRKESHYESSLPFLEVSRDTAQILMDDLWECGLRPSEGTGSAGALRAVESHLKDIKTIAFHTLKIPEVE